MKPKKRLEALQRRIKGHAMLKQQLSDLKPRGRLEQGGYKVPGSAKMY